MELWGPQGLASSQEIVLMAYPKLLPTSHSKYQLLPKIMGDSLAGEGRGEEARREKKDFPHLYDFFQLLLGLG